MTTQKIIFVLLVTFASSVLVFSDEAFDFYVEALRHSGYNPAEITTFQAELTVLSRTTLPDSVIADLTRKMEEQVEETVGWDDEKKQRTKEVLIGAFFASERKPREKKVFVKNSSAVIGLEDVPPLVLETNISGGDSFLYSIDSKNLPAGVSPENREKSADIIKSEFSTTVGTDRHGDASYYLSGRMQSIWTQINLKQLLFRDNGLPFSDVGIAAFKKECEANELTFTLSKERVKYEGDYSAHILQVHIKGQLREQFWIDPDRGYICSKAQTFCRNSGKVDSEDVSENFILDEYSQKWFPEKHVSTTEAFNGTRISYEYSLKPGTLVLNRPIPDSVFGVTVRENERVDDLRRDDLDKVTFFANQPGELDLPTVEKKSLDDIEWLTQREVRQYYPPPIEKTSFSWTQIMLMVLGITMIIWGLILHFPRKRSIP